MPGERKPQSKKTSHRHFNGQPLSLNGQPILLQSSLAPKFPISGDWNTWVLLRCHLPLPQVRIENSCPRNGPHAPCPLPEKRRRTPWGHLASNSRLDLAPNISVSETGTLCGFLESPEAFQQRRGGVVSPCRGKRSRRRGRKASPRGLRSWPNRNFGREAFLGGLEEPGRQHPLFLEDMCQIR